ncbi:MAG TPA: hypothetical protein VIH30_11355 [Aquirhabdus sp.]
MQLFKLSTLLVTVVIGGISTIAVAQEPQAPETEVEKMHRQDAYEQAIRSLEELRLLTENVANKKYSDCIKAYGNKEFCGCLRDKSPVGIDFAGYITIVTTPKEELGYSKASIEDRRMIDATLKSREVCVKR